MPFYLFSIRLMVVLLCTAITFCALFAGWNMPAIILTARVDNATFFTTLTLMLAVIGYGLFYWLPRLIADIPALRLSDVLTETWTLTYVLAAFAKAVLLAVYWDNLAPVIVLLPILAVGLAWLGHGLWFIWDRESRHFRLAPQES